MRKLVAVAVVLGLGLVPVFTGAVMAQKVHAPKAVWQAMVAGLDDIQSIIAAMTVFDMERAAKTADELVEREIYISTLDFLPKEVRDGHAKVAEAAKGLAAAAKAGEEQQMAKAIGEVLAACNACHYDLRDAERRKEQEQQ